MRKRTYDSEVTRMDNLRKGSLATGNNLAYTKAILELGIPEDQIEFPDLFESGLAELKYLNKEESNLEREVLSSLETFKDHKKTKEENYKRFYSWGKGVYQRRDVRAIDEKRRLLSEYFPYRFGNGSKIPASDLSSCAVNKIFDSIIESTKKRYKLD